MTFTSILPLFILAVAIPLDAATASSAIPNETFDYDINWPTGLNLGEAHWKARNNGTVQMPQWEFELTADARIPGFALIDKFHSKTSGNFCTETFSRDLQHGSRKSGESIDVDLKAKTATRKPIKGGGESTLTVPECVRDPLAFIFFVRRELLNGRVPPQQAVIYGSLYQVKLTSLGERTLESGGRSTLTDRVGVEIQGPSSKTNAEIFFARDAQRTPISVRIPLLLGAFSLELAH